MTPTPSQGIVDAAICFFIPYFASSPRGAASVTDIYSVGKTVFICMLGAVTIEARPGWAVAGCWLALATASCAATKLLVGSCANCAGLAAPRGVDTRSSVLAADARRVLR